MSVLAATDHAMGETAAAVARGEAALAVYRGCGDELGQARVLAVLGRAREASRGPAEI